MSEIVSETYYLDFPLDERPLYDTKSMSAKTWEMSKDQFQDWEFQIVNDMVYLRKHLSGPLNEMSKGWQHG